MNYGPFFPRRKPKFPVIRCDKYRPEIMCEGRRYAMGRGRFGYDAKRRGYYSLDLPELNTGVPMILEGCPFCYEELPSHLIIKPGEK